MKEYISKTLSDNGIDKIEITKTLITIQLNNGTSIFTSILNNKVEINILDNNGISVFKAE